MFDWEYMLHRVETIAGGTVNVPIGPRTINVGGTCYHVLPIVHPTFEKDPSLRMEARLVTTISEYIQELERAADCTVAEDLLREVLRFSALSLEDYDVIRRYGGGTLIAGLVRGRSRQLEDLEHWGRRSLEDSANQLPEKCAIIRIWKRYSYACRTMEDVWRWGELGREDASFWPIVFPERQPIVEDTMRSRMQAHRSRWVAKRWDLGDLLVVVGASHAPHVERYLHSGSHALLPALYNLDPVAP